MANKQDIYNCENGPECRKGPVLKGVRDCTNVCLHTGGATRGFRGTRSAAPQLSVEELFHHRHLPLHWLHVYWWLVLRTGNETCRCLAEEQVITSSFEIHWGRQIHWGVKYTGGQIHWGIKYTRGGKWRETQNYGGGVCDA